MNSPCCLSCLKKDIFSYFIFIVKIDECHTRLSNEPVDVHPNYMYKVYVESIISPSMGLVNYNRSSREKIKNDRDKVWKIYCYRSQGA